MSTYLERNPQAYPQWRRVRRNGATPSGVVVLHTAENATDFRTPDLGAEAVARFITTRPDPGSYHSLHDSDSSIQLAPWSAETWHDTRTNNHSVGISAAVRSADWNRLGARGHLIVDRMARAAAEYARWLRSTRGITIPARTITQAQALARVPGFVAHGVMDPTRRTDPGRDFPWGRFLATYAAALAVTPAGGGTTTPNAPTAPAMGALPDPIAPRSWFEMATKDELADVVTAAMAAVNRVQPTVLFRVKGTPAAYLDLGVARRWVSAAQVATWPTRPRFVDLPASDPFWSLPLVGNTP